MTRINREKAAGLELVPGVYQFHLFEFFMYL